MSLEAIHLRRQGNWRRQQTLVQRLAERRVLASEGLDAGRIGMELTSSFAMTPAASVSGLYMAHPESVYFAVGRIERDQVEDYARRKGMDLRTAERWLGPILNYDPSEVEVEAA